MNYRAPITQPGPMPSQRPPQPKPGMVPQPGMPPNALGMNYKPGPMPAQRPPMQRPMNALATYGMRRG